MGNILNPAEQIDQAFVYIIGFSFVLLFLITAVMIYFVVKYRRNNHPISSDIRGNWVLETVWVVIPTLIALSMFWVGWESYLGLRNVPPGAIEIELIGQKYSWILIYPNDKETENEHV
ncbi:MAG: cytochrome c oxidase subunit II, partial [Deltaproteobacteria bacterium]|nr:cytochrome c oxidase subunit II [Deltaproteobacteria bacterium]